MQLVLLNKEQNQVSHLFNCSMKEIIRKIIPAPLLNCYYNARKNSQLKKLYDYNRKRFVKYGARRDSEDALMGYLTMAIHGIEKGITMPDFRAGFGHDRMCELLECSETFIARYGMGNIQLTHLARVVHEYDLLHKKLHFRLDDHLQQQIDLFLAHFNTDFGQTIQVDCTREQYFSHRSDDFYQFSNSRHSARNFTDEPVSMELINKAVQLAQNAPSACNRQAPRIYIIQDKDKIKQVLALHGGNRGFGHTVDKLIIVCGYLPCYGLNERDCVYVDCGIFTMNLAYSLHYYGVGNCILNWSVSNENDIALRKIIPVKNEETVCTLIACGNVPEKFKVCTSGKKTLQQIVNHI